MKNKLILFILSIYSLNGLGQQSLLDTTFNHTGKVTTIVSSGFNGTAKAIAIDSTDRILVAGSSTNGISTGLDFVLVRYSQNGSLDYTFGVNGIRQTNVDHQDSATAILIQPNQKILVAGKSREHFSVVRYNVNGTLDNTFGNGGKMVLDTGLATGINLQSSGKIILTGNTIITQTSTPYPVGFSAIRLTQNGIVDSSFGVNGVSNIQFGNQNSNAYSTASVIQNDGKIVLVGCAKDSAYNTEFAMVRIDSNGHIDNSYGTNGKIQTNLSQAGSFINAQSVISQPDGKIVVAGNIVPGGALLLRYNSNGILDNSFGLSTDGTVISSAVNFSMSGGAMGFHTCTRQPDGKILAAGGYGQSKSAYFIARYDSTGIIDTSFNTVGCDTTGYFFASGGNETDYIYSMALQSDGKIVCAGVGYEFVGYWQFTVARYLPSASYLTSLSEISENKLLIYPIPANNALHLSYSSNIKGEINISNVLGANIYSLPYDGISQTLDITNLPCGTYIISIQTAESKVFKTFMKE